MVRISALLLTLFSSIPPALAAESSAILVGGATGRQGGAVVVELLERGHVVRGLTRKPESKEAIALRELGVEVVQGDYGDPESLRAAWKVSVKCFSTAAFPAMNYRKVSM